MSSLSWQTNGKKIKVNTLVSLDINAPEMQAFIDRLYYLTTQIDLAKLDFDIIPASDPIAFSYTIKTLDGRNWAQEIEFDTPSNPRMTFDVPDYFRLNEFAAQRDIRLSLIDLVQTYQLQSLTIRWD